MNKRMEDPGLNRRTTMTHQKAQNVKVGDILHAKDGYVFTVEQIEEKLMRQILISTLSLEALVLKDLQYIMITRK